MDINEHHHYFAIAACLVCNGWVLYVAFTAYIANIQAQIAEANYRLRISCQFSEAVAEDENQEREQIKNTEEWDI
jgi:hypothetical protein